MTLGRRDFITLLGGAAAAWPLASLAQQSALPAVGFLGTASAGPFASRLNAFRQGLSETGYVEGRNVTIEYRWAENQNDRLPALAAELVARKVNVIVTAGGTPAARAAKASTATIPIVFSMGNDPVQMGLVTSLNRPGSNITGVTNLSGEIGPKRLELLHEAAPAATIIALLVNPTNPAVETQVTELEPAAQTLGLQLHVLRATDEREFDAAFANMIQLRAGALVIAADPLFNTHSENLAAQSVHHALPAIQGFKEFAAAGGLMSYGDDLSEPFHQVGVYAGRILKGDKPADLPVQQSTRIELIINLKTAKALGLTIPITLLGRADEVIE